MTMSSMATTTTTATTAILTDDGSPPPRPRNRRRCGAAPLPLFLAVALLTIITSTVLLPPAVVEAVANHPETSQLKPNKRNTPRPPPPNSPNNNQKRPAHTGTHTHRHRLSSHEQAMSKLAVDLSSEEVAGELKLGSDDPAEAARSVMPHLTRDIEERLKGLFSKAKTPECRAKIATHLGYYLRAIGIEGPTPFSGNYYALTNQCTEEKYDFDDLPEGVGIGDIQGRTYKPDPSDEGFDDEYLDDWTDLKLLYVILTHDAPKSTIRLIEALTVKDEEGSCDMCTQFVVHVDGKSDDVQDELERYYANSTKVHLLPAEYRVRVNWGGFSMVNATLQALRYAFAIDRPRSKPLNFNKVVHMASTSYPLKSNTEIRRRIASYPLHANFFDVVFKPTDPAEASWQYFVECDDAVHRIYRLPPLTSTPAENGVDLYTASQWWISSREFAKYIAEALPGTFVRDFLDYAQHVVVADETFFGTVLRHTPFCHKHHNDNFLHLQFDRWENELQTEDRDERKCLMPRNDHCGRSPTTMTLDYLPILEVCNDLFARKFVDTVDSQIKDVIDMNRLRDEEEFRRAEGMGEGGGDDVDEDEDKFDPKFEGHGVLIVARDTLYDDEPLCLGLGETKNKVRLTPCFHEWVVETLAPGWETGAVILEETLVHNRWELGPCSTDGNLKRLPNGTMEMTPGLYSPTGPRCNLKMMDGLRKGRCVDGESDRTQPGGELQVFPCRGRWHQFLSFGNGTHAPRGSLHTNVPKTMLNRIQKGGREQAPFLCVGVEGRGDLDEEAWSEDEAKEEKTETSTGRRAAGRKEGEEVGATDKTIKEDQDEEDDTWPPLSEWSGEQLVTTRCDNVGAIVEWTFIPFIEEDDYDEQHVDTTSSSSAGAETEESGGERGGDEKSSDDVDDAGSESNATDGGLLEQTPGEVEEL